MHIKKLLIILLIGIFQVQAKEFTKRPIDINEISLEGVQSIVKTSPGFENFFNNLKQEQFSTLDHFLLASQGKMDEPILVHHSMGLLPASYRFPRLVVFNSSGPGIPPVPRPFFTFSGDKEDPKSRELEVMDWAGSDEKGYQLNFYLVQFQGADKPPLIQVNPPKCFQCHGPSQYPRPIFDPEPVWRGVYFSSKVSDFLGVLGDKELPYFKQFKIQQNQKFAWAIFNTLEKLQLSERREIWQKVVGRVYEGFIRELFLTNDILKEIWKLFLAQSHKTEAHILEGIIREFSQLAPENKLEFLRDELFGNYTLMKTLFHELDWQNYSGSQALLKIWFIFDDSCFQGFTVPIGECPRILEHNQAIFDQLLTSQNASRYNLLELPDSSPPSPSSEITFNGPQIEELVNSVVFINLKRIGHMIEETPQFNQFKYAFAGAMGCSHHFGQSGFEEGMGSFLPPALRTRMQPSYPEVKEQVQCNAENRVHFINSVMEQFNGGESISLKESQQHPDLVANLLYLTNSRPIHRPKYFTHLSPAFESGADVLHVQASAPTYGLGPFDPSTLLGPPLLEQTFKEEREVEKKKLIESGIDVFRSSEKELSRELCLYLKEKSISSLASLAKEASELPVAKVEGSSRKITDPLNPFASSCAGRVTVSEDKGKTIYTRLVEGTLCLAGTCVRNQFILKLNEVKELIDLVSLHDAGLKKHVKVKPTDTTKQEVPFTPQDVDNLMKNINLAQQDANNPLRRAVEGSWQAALREVKGQEGTEEEQALERSEKFYELLKKSLVGDASLDLTTHATVASLKPHVIEGGAYTSAHAYLMYWDTKRWIEKGAKNNTGGLVD